MADNLWIFFDDQAFEQYAYFDNRDPALFSEGTWQLSDGADFDLKAEKTDYGQITITRTKKFQPGTGYADYASEHTYDLKTLGYEQIVFVR